MQTKQRSPIHHRQKPQPFFNISKRRRLSLSNHSPQMIQTGRENQIVKQLNFFNRIKKKRKKSVLQNKSDSIESNYIQIQLMREQQKGKANYNNNKNIFSFFPTYTTLVDNQKIYLNKTMQQQSYPRQQKSENQTVSIEQPAQRQRLAPLIKIQREDNKKYNKGDQNINENILGFFNIQKLSLMPVYTKKDVQSNRGKIAFTAAIKTKRTITPRQSLDESKTIEIMSQIKQNEQDSNMQQKVIVKKASKSFKNVKIQLPSNIKILRPFIPPFERFYYFDFLWKISYSNGIKVEFAQNLSKKYKVYIGPGNNSMLIKTFFKRRQSWWSITQKIDEASFIWTQIKVNSIHLGQKNCKIQRKRRLEKQQIEDQNLEKKKNILQIKRNSKIFNNKLLQDWVSYYQNYKQIEQKLPQSFWKRNRLFKTTNLRVIQQQKIKIHNHFPRNYVLGNKKALFATMKRYYELMKQQVFEYLPLTFHVENGLDDKQYLKFLQYFYKKAKESKESQKSSSKIRNIWIVKPGEFTNRGNGIIVCRNLEEVKSIIKNKKRLQNGNNRTYIVQQYLDRPFLYYKRKFDLRHYMLITCINGHIKGYWYQLGYIRTTSYQYSVKNTLNSVHLTNDAVQKNLPDYGKYEKGNKLSYDEFEKYLEKQYEGKYSFYGSIYPKMKKIGLDSMRASAIFLDQERKEHNFEIFGFDFMIDSKFHPWLIQINTNPCLQLSSPVLMEVIPDMIENALKIGVDSIITPPYSFTQKRPRFNENFLQSNKFELLYDSSVEEEKLRQKFCGAEDLKLNYKQLQKDQDQIYEDDGIQLQD